MLYFACTQFVWLYRTGGIQHRSWVGKKKNKTQGHSSRVWYARTAAPSSVSSLKIEVRDHINEIMQQLWHTKVVKGIKLGHDGGIKIHDMTPLTLAAEIRQSHQWKHSVSLHSERTYQTGLIAPFVTYASPATCQTNLERRHMVRRRHLRKKVTRAPTYQRMTTLQESVKPDNAQRNALPKRIMWA